MEIAGSKVVVTGGAGFVGSHIIDRLVAEGASKVTAFDNMVRGRESNLAKAKAAGDVELVRGDICDTAALAEVIKGADYVFHQAALWLLECEQEPRKAVEQNIIGTFNVLEACALNNVKKAVVASSSSVYGEGSYLPTDEAHPFNNNLFYGATKVADEQLCRAFHKKYGLDYVALRYLNVYGPRMDYRSAYVMVIMNFLNRVDRGEPPQIYGDGSQTLDLVYIEDVARANLLALKSPATDVALNVASGKETTLVELAEIVLRLLDTSIEPEYKDRDKKLVARRYGCPKKAKELIGFETRVPVEEGIAGVIEWWRKDKAAAEHGGSESKG
jgi:UDP-glucose 4-epimerase